MEQLVEKREQQDGEPSIPYPLWELRSAVSRFLADRGLGFDCNVIVNNNGKWFEFDGVVDSQLTRSTLFSLVPLNDGRQQIIDKLQVVSPAAKRTAWV